jgi:hypothetical protein
VSRKIFYRISQRKQRESKKGENAKGAKVPRFAKKLTNVPSYHLCGPLRLGVLAFFEVAHAENLSAASVSSCKINGVPAPPDCAFS